MGLFIQGYLQGQKLFAECISEFVNAIVLTVVYIMGVGIPSLVAKMVGKRFLEMKPDSQKESYWVDVNLGKKKREAYYRQF